jgi:hypothetical protein
MYVCLYCFMILHSYIAKRKRYPCQCLPKYIIMDFSYLIVGKPQTPMAMMITKKTSNSFSRKGALLRQLLLHCVKVLLSIPVSLNMNETQHLDAEEQMEEVHWGLSFHSRSNPRGSSKNWRLLYIIYISFCHVH